MFRRLVIDFIEISNYSNVSRETVVMLILQLPASSVSCFNRIILLIFGGRNCTRYEHEL